MPSAVVTVTDAAGNQSYGPRSWPGARPWGDPKAGTTQVGGIRDEMSGAGAGAGEGVGRLRTCVSKSPVGINAWGQDTWVLLPG